MPRAKSKPAASPTPEVEAFLALLRAHEKVQRDLASLLKPHGLSQASYNVMRILRGAGADGMACGAIAGEMVQRVPDVTRLVDRLCRLGLVERGRPPEDRRIVRVRVTRRGGELLAELDDPVLAVHRLQFASLSRKELKELKALLDKVLAV